MVPVPSRQRSCSTAPSRVPVASREGLADDGVADDDPSSAPAPPPTSAARGYSSSSTSAAESVHAVSSALRRHAWSAPAGVMMRASKQQRHTQIQMRQIVAIESARSCHGRTHVFATTREIPGLPNPSP
eukprot:COSAG01_NODE_8833_length_2645_cov_1.747840_1_plen_128_part_10